MVAPTPVSNFGALQLQCLIIQNVIVASLQRDEADWPAPRIRPRLELRQGIPKPESFEPTDSAFVIAFVKIANYERTQLGVERSSVRANLVLANRRCGKMSD